MIVVPLAEFLNSHKEELCEVRILGAGMDICEKDFIGMNVEVIDETYELSPLDFDLNPIYMRSVSFDNLQ